MSAAGTQKTVTTIRVERDVYDELVKIQAEFYLEHRGRISLSDIIKERLLADRKPDQP